MRLGIHIRTISKQKRDEGSNRPILLCGVQNGDIPQMYVDGWMYEFTG